jgi:hypothetical protein
LPVNQRLISFLGRKMSITHTGSMAIFTKANKKLKSRFMAGIYAEI